MSALDGLAWGGLAWVTLGSTSSTGNILVVSIITAIAAGIISTLSPVLLAFVAFVVPELAIAASKMWLLDDPAYNALSFTAILYMAALLGQALNSSRSIRAAIELRFENVDLVEQLRLEAGIAAAAQREAEQANAAKSKFLAAASHDLRQPVHAQGLFLEVLSRTDQTQYQQELLASARAASEASSEMLNALLDFSRIEAGVIEPQPKPFRLQPLLHKMEKELAHLADEKEIVFRTRETRLVVRTDPVLLELILRNLVSNAIRYTERGGILLVCRQRGNQAVLEVWDTGIGIAPEQHKEVFREFHQLGNPERDRRKGLGLGLAIADGMARALKHELSLASKPGRGSVFRLTLPITALPVAKTAKPPSKTRLLNARVLVIDDDEIVREGMLHLLQAWGCQCDSAESIEDALAAVKLNVPDMVISDYRLREHRTGVEAIEAVRALHGSNIPAVLVTGDTAPNRLREAKASGIPLLHKPVSADMLYRKLVDLQQSAVY
jgi:signal transduction histidine kinase